MSKILVIGWGNPLRADDGLGCHAARQIGHRFKDDPRVEVVPCHQLAPEVAERIARAEFVIFVDAAAQGTPGTISEKEVLPDREFRGEFGQHLTPGVLLAAARSLHGSCPSAVLFTMAGWCFEFGERMSPAVTARFDDLLGRMKRVIEEHQKQLVVQ